MTIDLDELERFSATLSPQGCMELRADAFPALIAEIRELRGRAKRAESERDAERLRYGQQAARNAVFMRALATLARREGFASWAQNVVREADHAMMRVRPEDFTTASPGGSAAAKDRCTP